MAAGNGPAADAHRFYGDAAPPQNIHRGQRLHLLKAFGQKYISCHIVALLYQSIASGVYIASGKSISPVFRIIIMGRAVRPLHRAGLRQRQSQFRGLQRPAQPLQCFFGIGFIAQQLPQKGDFPLPADCRTAPRVGGLPQQPQIAAVQPHPFLLQEKSFPAPLQPPRGKFPPQAVIFRRIGRGQLRRRAAFGVVAAGSRRAAVGKAVFPVVASVLSLSGRKRAAASPCPVIHRQQAASSPPHRPCFR